MQTLGVKTILCVLLIGALSLPGCASRPAVSSAEPNAAAPAQRLPEGSVTTAEVLRAAQDVLTRMHFAIEKLDPNQGVIRTRPLRGAQFFEFWRSDNASTYAWEESNLQSIRRTVELRVQTDDREQRTEDGKPRQADSAVLRPPSSVLHFSSGLCVVCSVSVQRLSLLQREVAGTSEAYRVHASSTAALQRMQLGPGQRRGMTWIDLGQDPDLAARILSRVEQRLQARD